MKTITKHKKFGYVCTCHCHRDGNHIHEILPCCRLYREKYIDEDGTLDEDRLLAIYIERGIKLWTFWDRVKDRARYSWIGKIYARWLWWRKWRRLKHFKFPMVKKPYPTLKAEDIVSVHLMTSTEADSFFEFEHR